MDFSDLFGDIRVSGSKLDCSYFLSHSWSSCRCKVAFTEVPLSSIHV